MTFRGVDEAGLGPILGPYCCSSIDITLPGEKSPAEFFADEKKSPFPAGDSKKIYRGKNKRAILENIALSLIHLEKGIFPETIFDIIGTDNFKDYTPPWFQPEYTSQKLPLWGNKNIIENYIHYLKKDILFLKINLTVVSAFHFNQLLDKTGNKSRASMEIIAPHIQQDGAEKISVDRLGGVRYYKSWLEELYSDSVASIHSETAKDSIYNVKNKTISFTVNGDVIYPEISFASICAKYLREVSMKLFNDYWKKLYPNLKETAGYYTDGQRFLCDLKNLGVTIGKDFMVRKK